MSNRPIATADVDTDRDTSSNGHGEPIAPLRVTDGAPLEVVYGTADDLFSGATIPPSELYIPELGKTFFVRIISGKERDAYEQSLVRGRGTNSSIDARNMRAKLAALTLANADGSRMFKDTDASRLGDLPAKVLERIFDRSRKINGLTEEDTDDALGN